MARLLVIMGSGETSPTMSKVHRELLVRAGTGPAVMLDTPFGFQENADDISAKALAYFKESVQCQVIIASFPGRRERRPAGVRDHAGSSAGGVVRVRRAG